MGDTCSYVNDTRGHVRPRLTVADLFKSVWPRLTAKRAASGVNHSIRTIEAWLSERCAPSANTLFQMAEENRALRLELIRRLMEIDSACMECVGQDDRNTVGDTLDHLRRSPGQATAPALTEPLIWTKPTHR